MAFCSHCGTQIDDNTAFCPKCGAKVGESQSQSTNNAYDFSEKISSLNNTADSTSSFVQDDIEKNKGMAVLAYLSWLVLIPIFAAKDSKFARFHVNQGLVLAIFEAAYWIVAGVVKGIIWSVTLGFGIYGAISAILGLANIFFLVLAILGIVNAVNGRAKDLPLIGKIRLIK